MKKKINLLDEMYYFIAIFWLIVNLLLTTSSDSEFLVNLYGPIQILILTGLVIRFVLKIRIIKVKVFFIVPLAAMLFFIVYMTSRDKTILIALMFIIAYKGINTEVLIRKLFITYTAVIFSVILLCYTGVFEDILAYRNGSVRHSFGFVGANAFATTVFITLMLYIYIHFKSWKRRDNFIFLSVTMIMNTLTKSRMTFVMELCIFIFLFLYIYIPRIRNNAIIYKISSFCFVLCTLISVIGLNAYIKGNAFVQAADVFIGRLYWGKVFYQEYGYSLLGRNISYVTVKSSAETGEHWKGLDCAYLTFAIRYGIIILILFCSIYFLLGRYLKRTASIEAAMCVIFICIASLTENYMMNIIYNFTLFFIGEMLWQGTGKRKKLEA